MCFYSKSTCSVKPRKMGFTRNCLMSEYSVIFRIWKWHQIIQYYLCQNELLERLDDWNIVTFIRERYPRCNTQRQFHKVAQYWNANKCIQIYLKLERWKTVFWKMKPKFWSWPPKSHNTCRGWYPCAASLPTLQNRENSTMHSAKVITNYICNPLYYLS